MTETVSDWVLVPREPTPAMLEAGKAERVMTNSTSRVYQVMIANAPTPPQETVSVPREAFDAMIERLQFCLDTFGAIQDRSSENADLDDWRKFATTPQNEATEAESLRAERDALAKEVRQWEAAFNAAFPKPTIKGDAP